MIEIIPAIDLIDGKCVRLEQGDYNLKKEYSANPLDVARKFEDAGIKRLHLVDLDGAKAGKIINLAVLSEIASKTSLKVDFGGGIKSDEEIKKVFDNGAEMATIGSIAVTNPPVFEFWLDEYGADRLILGADIKDSKIAISGWKDVTEIDLYDFLKQNQEKGVVNVLCTDISKDGMLKGSAVDLYQDLIKGFPLLKIIASGGISSIEEIEMLNHHGVYGAIIGKAYYEGKIALNELKKFL